MRKLLILVLSFSSLYSFAQKRVADSVITEELLKYYVRTLSDDSMQGRFVGTPGWEKAKNFIVEEMKALGLQSIYGKDSTLLHQFTSAESGAIGTNIVSVLPGKRTDKYLLFSAHFDHVGEDYKGEKHAHPKTGIADTIYNGANDNASGVAAMLAIAGYFKAINNREYSIVFVAFSREDDAMLGSEALAEDFTDLKLIKQVINLEMLGLYKYAKPFVTEGVFSYDFVDTLNKLLKKMDPKALKNFFNKDKDLFENLFARSDNFPFAKRGIPANTIMASTTMDKDFHSPSDEWHRLNYSKMTETVKAIALACTALMNK